MRGVRVYYLTTQIRKKKSNVRTSERNFTKTTKNPQQREEALGVILHFYHNNGRSQKNIDKGFEGERGMLKRARIYERSRKRGGAYKGGLTR